MLDKKSQQAYIHLKYLTYFFFSITFQILVFLKKEQKVTWLPQIQIQDEMASATLFFLNYIKNVIKLDLELKLLIIIMNALI